MKKNPDYYIGPSKNLYAGYSTDKTISKNAASGGSVTRILTFLLEIGTIDAALVSKCIIKNNQVKGVPYLAKTRKDLLKSQTSVYFFIPTLKKIKEVENYPGKIAIVCLPCEVKIWQNLKRNNPKFKKRIKIIIGLFCGHASKTKLINLVIKKRGHRPNNVKKLYFRKGHWRGKMQIHLKNKKVDKFSFWEFSTYQNLFFFSEEKCLHCNDHTSELADISCGDIWSTKYKKHKHKHNIIITRSKTAENIIQKMFQQKKLQGRNIDYQTIWEGQNKSLTFHKHIKARSLLGKIFGYKIYYNKKTETARWNDYLAALIILNNVKLSNHPRFSKVIFFIPRKIWFLYLLLFKLLTSF